MESEDTPKPLTPDELRDLLALLPQVAVSGTASEVAPVLNRIYQLQERIKTLLG